MKILKAKLNINMTIAQQLKIKDFPFVIKDKNGNEIYHEDFNGDWWKMEYDSNRNLIYFENSNGYWWKMEFDSNGNQIYFENSYGDWDKSEYDSNGNQIYFENSYGYIKDNRPKVCENKIVEIDGVKYKLVKA